MHSTNFSLRIPILQKQGASLQTSILPGANGFLIAALSIRILHVSVVSVVM